MMNSVIALFDDASEANKARDELIRAGFEEGKLKLSLAAGRADDGPAGLDRRVLGRRQGLFRVRR